MTNYVHTEEIGSPMKKLQQFLKKTSRDFRFCRMSKPITYHNGEKIAEGKPDEIVKNKEIIKAYLGEEK